MKIKSRLSALKSPILSIFAIISAFIGSIFLIQGIILINSGYSYTEEINVEGQSFTIDKLTSIMFTNATSDSLFSTIKVNFDTLVIFQGDQVGITATALDVKPNVQKIFILFTDTSFTPMSNLGEFQKQLDTLGLYHNAVVLLPNSNPPFNTREYVEFPIANQKVMVYAVVVTDTSVFTIKRDNPSAFVQERSDKTSIEMYKLMLKQYEEQQKTNREQDRTNSIFLGFSWIGVALIMILGGVDVLLRIRFDRKDDDNEHKIYH